MDARWCPCRGGQSDRWRTDGTGHCAPGCIAVYAGYTPGYTPLVSGMRAISMEKLRKIPARAATESTEQPEMTASGADRRGHAEIPALIRSADSPSCAEARWLAGRPPDGGRWRVCVCISANRLLASCSWGGDAACGRATRRYAGDTDPAALARRHISTYPTCTRTIYSIYSAFLFVWSCSTSFQ